MRLLVLNGWFIKLSRLVHFIIHISSNWRNEYFVTASITFPKGCENPDNNQFHRGLSERRRTPMSEIKWISKKSVEIQEGTGLQETDFCVNKCIGNGQLYICSKNGAIRIKLRTMPDTGEKYKYMAKGVTEAALNNADELLERTAAVVGKSILAAITHTPSGVSRRIKVTNSMTGWEHDMAKLKESNYGMNEITKEIWSKKLGRVE